MFQHFFELHGRYEPEGPFRLYVQGGYCWLLCASRCVPFPGWQAPSAPHFGRYGPEVQLQWHVQSWFFWCFCTSRCVARGVQENWILGDGAYFSGPLYLAVTCSSCLPEEYRFAYFREMTSGMFPVFSALLGSTEDTCSASVYEAFLGRITLST